MPGRCIGTGFEQEHALACTLGQTRGEHATSGAGAADDEIEMGGHATVSCLLWVTRLMLPQAYRVLKAAINRGTGMTKI